MTRRRTVISALIGSVLLAATVQLPDGRGGTTCWRDGVVCKPFAAALGG